MILHNGCFRFWVSKARKGIYYSISFRPSFNRPDNEGPADLTEEDRRLLHYIDVIMTVCGVECVPSRLRGRGNKSRCNIRGVIPAPPPFRQTHLDHSRPLWQVTLIQGYPGGTVMITK